MANIKIDTEVCIGCRACAIMCPEGTLALIGDYCSIVAEPETCTECGICAEWCPVDAISVGRRAAA